MMHVLARAERWVAAHRAQAGVATAGALAVGFMSTLVVLPRPAPASPSAIVRVQPFSDTIVETGTIATQYMAIYSSTVTAAAAKIVEIVPEGQVVQAGDVLFRLDAAPFERTLLGEQAALRQAEAELTRAVEEARLELFRLQGDFDAATQLFANAERSLANEKSGKGQLAVIEAEAALGEAQRTLKKAQTEVDDLKPLLAERFITATEFARAESALKSAEDQGRVAAARRDSVVGYERPAAASKAEAEVNSAREGLIRDTDSARARTSQRRAIIGAARNHVDEITVRIAGLVDQIARATVRAKGPGLVVYRDLFFANDRRKPQVGDEVFPNQPVIAVPDSSQFIVEMSVREVDLHKVEAQQRVTVRVDAYPDLRLSASVASIGALAQEDPARAGTKFFPLTVRLAASDPRLRTGMSATIEIEVAALPAAMVIPVEAVFGERSQRYVVVVRGGRAQRRPVRIAAENDSLAAVAEGLGAGDRVLLVDPTRREGS
jgi:HlyD family secretion protein